MKKTIYFIFLLLMIGIASAEEIKIVKESANEIKIGEIIEVKIIISNPYQEEKEVLIKEILPKDIEVIDPLTVFKRRNDALEVTYYEWVTKISPDSVKTITYKIKPLLLGEYSIGSTKVIDKSNLKEIESNQIGFNVKCIPDNKCDSNENSITCSEDCSTGASDGICDYKADGICDMDCDTEPDCKKFNFNMNYFIIPFIVVIILAVLIWLGPKIFKKKEKIHIQEDNPKIKYVQKNKPNKESSSEEDPLSGIENNQ